MEHSIYSMAHRLGVWTMIRQELEQASGCLAGESLLAAISVLPVRRSNATRSLGSYVSRAGHPVCIRLQFALEAELLRETFLHELAHLCDHLMNQSGRCYRRAHGPGWLRWAQRFGLQGNIRGESEVLTELYRRKLKPVAVCHKCQVELRRARRLNKRQTYYHRGCGGRFVPL